MHIYQLLLALPLVRRLSSFMITAADDVEGVGSISAAVIASAYTTSTHCLSRSQAKQTPIAHTHTPPPANRVVWVALHTANANGCKQCVETNAPQNDPVRWNR